MGFGAKNPKALLMQQFVDAIRECLDLRPLYDVSEENQPAWKRYYRPHPESVKTGMKAKYHPKH